MEIFLAEIRQPLHAIFFSVSVYFVFICECNKVFLLLQIFNKQYVLFCCQAWNTQSALQILSVVLEYSDSSILDYLYGIVEHVSMVKPLSLPASVTALF